jgi:inward rectifier potassium channel
MGDLGSTRVFGHAGGRIVRVGMRRRPMKDLFHWMVTGSWTRLVLVYCLVYLATQALFGVAHFQLGPAEAGRGSVTGYLLSLASGSAPGEGAPDPRAVAASAVSGIEVFVRWLELAVGSGMIFAKFSLVRARVLFSRVAVVTPYQGGLALAFRMANERASHMMDAKVQAMLVWDEPGEGEAVRRAHDLALARGGSALFAHAWTAIHPIDRASPLFGHSAETLAGREAEVIVTLSGFDEGLIRTMHARHVYPAGRIRWNAQFREIVTLLPNGVRAVDYRKFHDVTPVAEGVGDERTPRRARPHA